jgi:hypothetical protein
MRIMERLTNALLMTILTQTFLPFVGGHFMALTLFSAWHYKLIKSEGYVLRAVKTA